MNLQRLGKAISKINEKFLQLRKSVHIRPTHKKKVSAPQGVSIVFTATSIVGGIIWVEFKSSKNLLPALLLLRCRSQAVFELHNDQGKLKHRTAK